MIQDEKWAEANRQRSKCVVILDKRCIRKWNGAKSGYARKGAGDDAYSIFSRLPRFQHTSGRAKARSFKKYSIPKSAFESIPSAGDIFINQFVYVSDGAPESSAADDANLKQLPMTFFVRRLLRTHTSFVELF